LPFVEAEGFLSESARSRFYKRWKNKEKLEFAKKGQKKEAA